MATGRYAVWVWHTEVKAGEHETQKCEPVKHSATLVADMSGD
jgi:hypothetical protein